MLRSGDRVEVIGNSSEHCFEIGDKVYFLGMYIDGEIVFICTNGRSEQGLYWEDISL